MVVLLLVVACDPCAQGEALGAACICALPLQGEPVDAVDAVLAHGEVGLLSLTDAVAGVPAGLPKLLAVEPVEPVAL